MAFSKMSLLQIVFIISLSIFSFQGECFIAKPSEQETLLKENQETSHKDIQFQKRAPVGLEEVRRVGSFIKSFQKKIASPEFVASPPVKLSESDLVSMSITSRALASFIRCLEDQVEFTEEDVGVEFEMVNMFNTFYVTPADVAGTEIGFIMDTGSSGIVVNSDLCKTNGCQTNPAVETEAEEEWQGDEDVAVSLGDEWEIIYGSGSVTCQLGEGSVSVAGMTVPNQGLCLMEDEKGILYQVASLNDFLGKRVNMLIVSIIIHIVLVPSFKLINAASVFDVLSCILAILWV